METIMFSYLAILLIVKWLAPTLEFWKVIMVGIPIAILNWLPAFMTYCALRKQEGMVNDDDNK